MTKMFKILVLVVFVFGFLALLPVDVYANDLGSASELGIPDNDSFGSDQLNNVLNTVFSITGSLAVIFVIVGGFKYVVGSGKPEELQKAKNTILYAVIGLIISLFAMVIINFVISRL
ncbi:MAG: pilin [Candidatus Saccharimonadales bacterium]